MITLEQKKQRLGELMALMRADLGAGEKFRGK